MEQFTTRAQPLIAKIRPEAKEIYDKLDPAIQEMYRHEVCPMGGEHLTKRQLNRCIIEGIPPICLKHYKQMKGQMEGLVQLFNQTSLL